MLSVLILHKISQNANMWLFIFAEETIHCLVSGLFSCFFLFVCFYDRMNQYNIFFYLFQRIAQLRRFNLIANVLIVILLQLV